MLNNAPSTLAQIDASGGDTYAAANAPMQEATTPALPTTQPSAPAPVAPPAPAYASGNLLTGIAMLAQRATSAAGSVATSAGNAIADTAKISAENLLQNSKPINFNRSDQINTAIDTLKGRIDIPQGSHLSYVNNNPGNLRFAGQAGAIPGKSGFAQFPSPELGFIALQNQIQLDQHRGLTLQQFLGKYAPPSENDTAKYIANVSKSLGLAPAQKISAVPVGAIASIIAQYESGSRLIPTA
jgi:hypothetical protein